MTGNTSSCCIGLDALPVCGGDLRAEVETRCNVLDGCIFATCNDIVNPAPLLEDCVIDYCNCNETNREICYCSNLAAHALAICNKGH